MPAQPSLFRGQMCLCLCFIMFIYMFSQRQPQFEETHVAKGARERILCLQESRGAPCIQTFV